MLKYCLPVCAGLFLVAATAVAGPPNTSDGSLDLPLEPSITNPDWVKKPTGEELANLYPPLALQLGLAGRVSISCNVTLSGDLNACKVVSEHPTDLGFGDATLLAAGDFKMKPAMKNGVPTQGIVTIPLDWRLDARVSASNPAKIPAIPPISNTPSLVIARHIVALQGIEEADLKGLDLSIQRSVKLSVQNGAPAPPNEQVKNITGILMRNRGEMTALHKEYLARNYASRLSENELRTIEAFMASPAAKVWINIQHDPLSEEQAVSLIQALDVTTAKARKDFCSKHDCL